MGQFISTNRNDNCNDELINTLIKREYIHTINVEKAFRSVDRGLYYTSDNKQNAYRDTAWQFDKIHLSAPSIYATVLECLNLQQGHKFLNIGSGVGYFSTIAGLLLGVNGVNHGIEIHNSLIDIAYTKLEEFKQNAAAIDYFEFCEPVFIEGNAFELLSVGYYDRVYCGAAVPPAESSFIKSFIKVGGVLVMPMEGFLVKFVRTDEYTWKTIDVLEVSFTDLVIPEKCDITKVAKFPSVEPLSLQELCRSNIRASIRNSLNESFPDLQMRTKCKPLQSYDQKYFNSDDPLNQFVRIQYGATEQGMLSLRNIVDTFAGLDDAISDTGSISAGTEANRENNDGDNNSDDDDNDDDEEKNTSEQRDKRFHKKVKSDTKRKSPEAGCSKQIRKLPGKPKNTKRMRMDTFSTVKNYQMSQSSNSTSDLWDTMSSETLSDDDDDIDDDSESWVSSEENDDDDDNSTRNFNRMYDTLYGDNSRESESDSEAARELILYRFLGERKDNELSKLLKVKIDLLPVPILLKRFLNYLKP